MTAQPNAELHCQIPSRRLARRLTGRFLHGVPAEDAPTDAEGLAGTRRRVRRGSRIPAGRSTGSRLDVESGFARTGVYTFAVEEGSFAKAVDPSFAESDEDRALDRRVGSYGSRRSPQATTNSSSPTSSTASRFSRHLPHHDRAPPPLKPAGCVRGPSTRPTALTKEGPRHREPLLRTFCLSGGRPGQGTAMPGSSWRPRTKLERPNRSGSGHHQQCCGAFDGLADGSGARPRSAGGREPVDLVEDVARSSSFWCTAKPRTSRPPRAAFPHRQPGYNAADPARRPSRNRHKRGLDERDLHRHGTAPQPRATSDVNYLCARSTTARGSAVPFDVGWTPD